MISNPFSNSYNGNNINFGINLKSLDKPNNYFLGGRIHIKNAIVVVCVVTCLRGILESFLSMDTHLYIASSDPKTTLYGNGIEILTVILLYFANCGRNQSFIIPYIIVQFMFITIHGITLILDILRCIWPGMPENPILEYKEGNSLEFIRLLVISSIFIVDCSCLKIILKVYVYFESQQKYSKTILSTTSTPHNQTHFSIDDNEIHSYSNPNFDEQNSSNDNISGDEDDLVLTRDYTNKKNKPKGGNLK
uniref:Uncharacterized protein n=1 Tax=Parastrongyloides trichosuri TaxID=131310 RepID=A0A0N4Z167_PARTI